MPFSSRDLQFGPVVVVRGKHKGRIGYLDDETTHRGKVCGIVKFADPLLTPFYQYVPLEYLDHPNTQQLIKRHELLRATLSPYFKDESDSAARVVALEELALVAGILNERMFEAQFERGPRGARLFISHSSADKDFVRGLATDLAARGHQPWLDEWEILAGEAITEKVSAGIEDADFLVLVLSSAAVQSSWVEQEWQAKHWTEVNDRKVRVIPVLKDSCEIPTLLRTKKYVDMRDDKYSSGLELLLASIGRLLSKRTEA